MHFSQCLQGSLQVLQVQTPRAGVAPIVKFRRVRGGGSVDQRLVLCWNKFAIAEKSTIMI